MTRQTLFISSSDGEMQVKKNLRNLIICIITIALTFALILWAGHILDPKEACLAFDTIKAFHSLEKDSCDVLIYGSSHAWKGCDTRVMKDKYGITAYNYGCNWQSINTSLLFLEDSLRTQSPKVACIEVWLVNSVLRDCDMNGQIYYTKTIPDFKGKRDFIKQCFGNDLERYASYCFPLIMFHENWKEVNEETSAKPS